jgi:hypothetical protein
MIITVNIDGVIAGTDGNKWMCDDKMLQQLLNMSLKLDARYIYYPSPASKAVDKAKKAFPLLEVVSIDGDTEYDPSLTY